MNVLPLKSSRVEGVDAAGNSSLLEASNECTENVSSTQGTYFVNQIVRKSLDSVDCFCLTPVCSHHENFIASRVAIHTRYN